MKKWYWEGPGGIKGIAEEVPNFLFGSKVVIFKEGGWFGSEKIGEVNESKEEEIREFLEDQFGKPVKIWR